MSLRRKRPPVQRISEIEPLLDGEDVDIAADRTEAEAEHAAILFTIKRKRERDER